MRGKILSRFKNIFIITLILLFIIPTVLPIFSIARNVEELQMTEGKTMVYLYSNDAPENKDYNACMYMDNELFQDGCTYIRGGRCVDSGVKFNIFLRERTFLNLHPETNDIYVGDQYVSDLYFCSSIQREYIRSFVGREDISLSASEFNELKEKIPNSKSTLGDYYFELCVYSTNTKKHNKEHMTSIKCYVNENKIKIARSQNNATIIGDTLYIKKNELIDITTTWAEDNYHMKDGEKTSAVTDGEFSATQNIFIQKLNSTKCVVQATGDGAITWRNQYGTECSINVKVSNFASSSMGVNGQNDTTKAVSTYGANNTYNVKGVNYITDRDIYCEKGKTASIKITPYKVFGDVEYNTDDLIKIKELSSFSENKINMVKQTEYYNINFIPNDNGLLMITYKDYKGNLTFHYWRIIMVDKINAITIVEINEPQPIQPKSSDVNNNKIDEGRTSQQQENKANVTVYKNPKVECKVNRINASTVNVEVTATDCTHIKYAITKRNLQDGKLAEYSGLPTSYENFKGTEVATNKCSININALEYGSGYYDFTVAAKNTVATAWNTTAIGPNYINVKPTVDLIPLSDKQAANNKTFQINLYDPDKDNLTGYAYLVRKDAKSEYVEPSVETIKANGIKLNGKNTEYEINTNKNATGVYDLTVYVEDTNGAYNISSLSNIVNSNIPKIVYQIQGEEGDSSQGYTATLIKRDYQNITINVSDDDLNDSLSVSYFISEQDLSKGNTVIPDVFKSVENFKKVENCQKKAFTSNIGSFKIQIPPVEGKCVQKYVYILVEDKYGVQRFMETGSITVDDTPLELRSIYTNKIGNGTDKIGYSIGKELQIICEFNHQMKTICPDLYIEIGETERKQDSVGFSDNKIIYKYNIEEDDNDGDIALSRFDYHSGTFMDKYSVENTYSTQLSATDGVLDFVQDLYYVDTTRPKIEKIEIKINTDQNSIMESDENNIYINKCSSAKMVVTYDDTVIGKSPDATMEIGNRNLFKVSNTEKEARTQTIYDIKNWIDFNTKNYTGGKVELNSFYYNVTLTDDVGNAANVKDLPEVVYVINGYETTKDIIMDNYIYESTLKADEMKVDRSNKYAKNTEFIAFYEYLSENEGAYYDESGITSIKLQISHNNEQVVVKDKNNNILTKDVEGFENALYTYNDNYTLSIEQLPVKFVLDEVGDYVIAMEKNDLVRNTTKEEFKIKIVDSYTLNKDLSGLNLDSNEFYNYYGLTEEQKKYNLVFDVTDVTDIEDIWVYVLGPKGEQWYTRAAYDTSYTELGKVRYTFDIVRGGKYRVKVCNMETSEITELEDQINVENVYIPGDTDFNGAVNSIDTNKILKYIIGIGRSESLKRAADVNNDNSVDVGDAILLNRFIGEDSAIKVDDNGYLYIDE